MRFSLQRKFAVDPFMESPKGYSWVRFHRLELASPQETQEAVSRFAEEKLPGLLKKNQKIFLLEGGLGSGKTFFVRSLLEGHCDDPVQSPTYTIYNVYQTSWGEALHIDLYRLGEKEVLSIDLEEMIETAQIVFCEWWRKAKSSFLPFTTQLVLVVFSIPTSGLPSYSEQRRWLEFFSLQRTGK